MPSADAVPDKLGWDALAMGSFGSAPRIRAKRMKGPDEKPADAVHICRLEEESLGTSLSQLSDVACSAYHK